MPEVSPSHTPAPRAPAYPGHGGPGAPGQPPQGSLQAALPHKDAFVQAEAMKRKKLGLSVWKKIFLKK